MATLQMNWPPSLHTKKLNTTTNSTTTTTTTATTTTTTKRKTGTPPLGLRNLGNSCYVNSVLQCLTYTPPLANYCLKHQHTSTCNNNKHPFLPSSSPNCPFCLLERRIVRNLCFDATFDSPNKILNSLHVFGNYFRLGRQEDAHEFLLCVINGCHEACIKKKNGGNGDDDDDDDSIVKEIFSWALRSQLKCLSCGNARNKNDDMIDLSLQLLHSTSVKDAMQEFFKPEVLDGADKYKCEKCKKLVVAKKHLSIFKAPNVLVIQLKRFESIHGKIDRHVAFEEVLLLSSYMCDESQDPHPEYSLFGTIVHSGNSLDSGHYYAYIKDTTGQWYCCNDSHVSPSTLQEVLSEKVYILFFSRTNHRSQPTKSASSTNGVKYHNGIGASPTLKAIFPSKSVAPRPHEALNSKKIIPTIHDNGKVLPSPPIKFGLLKTLDSKRVHGNGSTLSNGNAKKHNDMKESSDMDKIKNKTASITNDNVVNENGSSDAIDHKSKQNLLSSHDNDQTLGTQKLPLSHENGQIPSSSVKPTKTVVAKDSGLRHTPMGKGTDSDHLSHGEEEKYPISGYKRKSPDQESNNSLQDGHREIIEKLKETITEDASSRLRSSGWYDEVYSFMCARKRLCAAGNTSSKSELKKMMIAEARSIFSAKIPASLKEDLVRSLTSISLRRDFLDA